MENREEAVKAVLNDGPFSLILTDINMARHSIQCKRPGAVAQTLAEHARIELRAEREFHTILIRVTLH